MAERSWNSVTHFGLQLVVEICNIRWLGKSEDSREVGELSEWSWGELRESYKMDKGEPEFIYFTSWHNKM